jgi:hypothetical protein
LYNTFLDIAVGKKEIRPRREASLPGGLHLVDLLEVGDEDPSFLDSKD